MNTQNNPSFFRVEFKAVIALILLNNLTSPLTAQEPVDYFAGNGSFEGGDFVSPLFPGAPFSGSSSAVPGWTMTAQGSSVTWLANMEAQDGDRHIILRSRGGSTPGSSSAYFDFAISPVPFTVGELYELRFWAAGGVATSGVNRLSMSLSYDPIELPAYTQAEFDALETLEWQEIIVPFVPQAEGGAMWVSIDSIPVGGNSSIYLDNFSIRPVPEPSGVLLVALAACVGLCVRRRGDD
jgi:hypothetical protein